MKYLILLFTINAYAFTFNTNFEGAFSNPAVNVRVTSNFTCVNAGVDAQDMRNIIGDAVNYWNQIPSSSLRLSAAADYPTSSADFAGGHLCVGASCNLPIVPAVSDIVITCNTNAADNFTSSSIIATTLPTNYTSDEILGSVIIINDTATTKFPTLSYSDKVAVIAHEIGHAFGLGHSGVSNSLMYFSTVPKRKSVGRDDIAGATYLYPRGIASCGTIGNPTDFMINFIIGLLLAFIVFAIPLKKRKQKQKLLAQK
jgi:hypothetical protein